MAHIWACPPSEGDDYIFHCHPVEQKIPKPKRLQEWYKKMLDKGIVERIVLDYKVSTKKSLLLNVTSMVCVRRRNSLYKKRVFFVSVDVRNKSLNIKKIAIMDSKLQTTCYKSTLRGRTQFAFKNFETVKF